MIGGAEAFFGFTSNSNVTTKSPNVEEVAISNNFQDTTICSILKEVVYSPTTSPHISMIEKCLVKQSSSVTIEIPSNSINYGTGFSLENKLQPQNIPVELVTSLRTVSQPLKISELLPNSNDFRLWVDKYRPIGTQDLIGSTETVKKLRYFIFILFLIINQIFSDWLRNWNAVHVTKSMKIPYTKENPGGKAVLLR